MQDLHAVGIESVEADECCQEENVDASRGVDCDANMRRYRKYHGKITSFVSGIDGAIGSSRGPPMGKNEEL